MRRYRKNSDTHKFCPKCQTTKPRSKFYRNRASLDGYQGYCGVCMNRKKYESIAKKKDYYLEMGRRNQRARRHRAPDAIKAEKRRSYERHRDYILARNQVWFDAHPGKREHFKYMAKLRRRAREYAAFVEEVEPIVVWERDGGVCHICQETVSFYQMHLDHVIPISKGGEHSYANIKASHSDCNQWKHARIVPELVTGAAPSRVVLYG